MMFNYSLLEILKFHHQLIMDLVIFDRNIPLDELETCVDVATKYLWLKMGLKNRVYLVMDE